MEERRRENLVVAGKNQEARRSREYWAEVVSSFEASSLKQGEYCKHRGVKLGNFRQWLYRIRAEKKGDAKDLARFVPLQMPSVERGCPCKLRVGSVELSFVEVPPVRFVAELCRLMDR